MDGSVNSNDNSRGKGKDLERRQEGEGKILREIGSAGLSADGIYTNFGMIRYSEEMR